MFAGGVEITVEVEERLGKSALLKSISDYKLYNNKAEPTLLSDD